jgi:hypothetical protein
VPTNRLKGVVNDLVMFFQQPMRSFDLRPPSHLSRLSDNAFMQGYLSSEGIPSPHDNTTMLRGCLSGYCFCSGYIRMTNNSSRMRTMMRITIHHDDAVSERTRCHRAVNICCKPEKARQQTNEQTLTFILPYELGHPLVRSLQPIIRRVHPRR